MCSSKIHLRQLAASSIFILGLVAAVDLRSNAVSSSSVSLTVTVSKIAILNHSKNHAELFSLIGITIKTSPVPSLTWVVKP